MKALVIKTEGKIVSSNFDEFEREALSVANSIRTELVSDEDFIIATEHVKNCKDVELKLQNAKQQAMMEQEDISALFTRIDRMTDSFREKRLTLERAIKNEKESRKNDIIRKAVDVIIQAGKGDLEWHFLNASFLDAQERKIREAVKGKRSLQSMEEVVGEVVTVALDEIEGIGIQYAENVKAIEDVEKDFPLFPDKKKLALAYPEAVQSEIKARVSEYKLKQKEAEERRKEQEQKEAEERRIAEESNTIEAPPKREDPPVEHSLPRQEEPRQAIDSRIIIVSFQGANLALLKALSAIREVPGVIDAQVQK